MRNRALLAAVLSSVILPVMANQARAGNGYFDDNGTAAGYGITSGDSWDGVNWAATSGGTVATTAWVPGNFARFLGGTAGSTYIITVAADESMTGMYDDITGVNLTFNAIGTGDLNLVAGNEGFLGLSGNTVTVNCPITGAGELSPEVNGGNLYLDGINNYSGGTDFTYGSNLVYFNSGSSFGTGPMINGESATGFAPLLATGGATITLPNAFQQGTTSGAGINFSAVGNTPVVSTGTWTLGAATLNLRNNGVVGAPVTLTNTISGTAGIIISGANGGTITFSGANSYSGTTTIGASGDTNITLILGASGTIASSKEVIMAGGTLNPDGINQAMSATTLGMTAASTIDFGGTSSEVDFANSSTLGWTGTLNLANWNPAVDELRFGTDSTGLTTAQLADIEFNGAGAGTATLNADGYVVVPEPTSLSLLALAAMPLLRRRRA